MLEEGLQLLQEEVEKKETIIKGYFLSSKVTDRTTVNKCFYYFFLYLTF